MIIVITIRISDQSDLHIPRRLSDKLSLSDGDQVEFVRRGDAIILQKVNKLSSPRPMRKLAGLVKSLRPRGSVDVSAYMNKKGYEYLCGGKHS
ncbi:MAG: AbrB/MazE/SpoVT family DNA-binding domain-containing protein [Anaerolineales bacterium]